MRSKTATIMVARTVNDDTTMGGIDMKLFKLAALVAVIAGFFIVPAIANAAPSLYRPFPNGIDAYNAPHAWQQVQSRTSWDGAYSGTIAREAGRSKFIAAEFKPVGYQNGMPGTVNSAVTGSGGIVPLQDHGGSQSVRVLIVMNVVSQKTVALMVRCGNPRLHTGPYVAPIPWHPFSKGTVIRINRSVHKNVKIVCKATKQTVTGKVIVTLRETVRGTTWGKVQGNLNLKLRLKVQAQVRVLTTLKCGPAPKGPTGGPPTVNCPSGSNKDASGNCVAVSVNCPAGTTKDSAGNCVAVAINCPAGYVKDSAGNCIAQTNTAAQDCQARAQAMGPNTTWQYNPSTVTCTITQININTNCSNTVVIVGGGSPVITQGGNCNNNPPPACVAPNTIVNGVCTPPTQPPASCVTITSVIDLNDVPVGKNSGQLPLTVNSCGTGSVTIDPGNGGISSCNSSTPLASIKFDLVSGDNSFCVIYYAPLESAVNSGSITYTAIQGPAKDVKTDTFAIKHPVQT